MKRRDFLKNSATLYALASLPLKALARKTQKWSNELRQDLPIMNLSENEFASSEFNGDDIHRPHDLLWDIDGYLAKKGPLPKEFETADVAIIGGGISGLTAAYQLRHQKTVLLEQDPRLGGNSKGENWKGSQFSIGAAYMIEPEEGSDIHTLLQDLGILNEGRRETADETTVFFQNQFARGFWQGVTDPEARAQFLKVFSRLKELNESEDFDWEGPLAQQTDSMSFAQWLQNEFGDLHPHLKEYFQVYGWSSFCGSIDELSAFQFLGFIAPETGSLLTFPGGNSYVAHKMAQKIRQDSSHESLRSGCIVLRIKTTAEGVEVLYEDSFEQLKILKAKKAIVACPKFVAAKIVPQMPDSQINAISKLLYRSYVVTNVLMKKSIPSPSYELFCMKGEMPATPSAMNPGNRSFTDICFGSWAQNDKVDHSVLTLYHGLPYDGARQFLFNPTAHDKYRAWHAKDIDTVLQSLKLSSGDVFGMRLTRWGHALPIAAKGLIQSKAVQAACENIEQKIFFANQDNWANPSFEAAHESAMTVAAQIQKLI